MIDSKKNEYEYWLILKIMNIIIDWFQKEWTWLLIDSKKNEHECWLIPKRMNMIIDWF